MRHLMLYPRIWERENILQLLMKTGFRKRQEGVSSGCQVAPMQVGKLSRDLDRRSHRVWVWGHFQVGCGFAQEGLTWAVR